MQNTTLNTKPENTIRNSEVGNACGYFKPLPTRAANNEARKIITIKCDGRCKQQPKGIGTWAFIACDEDGEKIHQAYGDFGFGEGMTNNVADYRAVIEALKWVLTQDSIASVVIQTDLELIVKQLNDEWRVNTEHILKLHKEASKLLDLANAEIEWIPTSENQDADDLTHLAYDEALKKYERDLGLKP